MELDNRLIILKDSGQIDEDVFEKTLKVINVFQSKWNIKLTEENAAMFITHFSIGLQRVKNKENIGNVDEEIALQVKNDKHYAMAVETIKIIEKTINVNIPDNEKIFVALHICALFEMNK